VTQLCSFVVFRPLIPVLGDVVYFWTQPHCYGRLSGTARNDHGWRYRWGHCVAIYLPRS
jgi:hypothetical protein